MPLEAKDLSVSQSEDNDAVTRQATALVDGGRWRLCNDGKGLEREFKFKTFKATWDFMTAVATECKKAKHHPEWTNVYNKTHIRWTTHNPAGLSSKDTTMAKFCDEVGVRFKEVVAEPVPGDGDVGGEGTMGARDGDWKVEARDCCGGSGSRKKGDA